MNDYIKRENALNAFNNAFYSGLAAKIKEIPSEDVEPVRHGWWKDLDDTEFRVNGWYCSQCLYEISDRYGKYRYCPMCGAKMKEGDTDEIDRR